MHCFLNNYVIFALLDNFGDLLQAGGGKADCMWL